MRISFDVDDTLVLYEPGLPSELVVPWWWRWRFREPLRFGTRTLMQSLIARGHELCIYTTSYRPPVYLRGWFRCIGVRLVHAINQDVHDQIVLKSHFPGYPPSKYPPAFGIDLHVDDSEGVFLEGREHGFRVVVVSPNDADWVTRVLSAVENV
jgi:hypothetical protein